MGHSSEIDRMRSNLSPEQRQELDQTINNIAKDGYGQQGREAEGTQIAAQTGTEKTHEMYPSQNDGANYQPREQAEYQRSEPEAEPGPTVASDKEPGPTEVKDKEQPPEQQAQQQQDIEPER